MLILPKGKLKELLEMLSGGQGLLNMGAREG